MDAESHHPQPRLRPESMIAQNFSLDLDSLFGLHSGVTIGNLNATVQQKKRNVSTQEQELLELEERLREAEERLAQASGSSPPNNAAYHPANPSSQLQASAGAADKPASTAPRRPSADRAEASFYRPMPGAMPRTPTAGLEAREYVTVDRTR